jgi:hypothetical protein
MYENPKPSLKQLLIEPMKIKDANPNKKKKRESEREKISNEEPHIKFDNTKPKNQFEKSA